MRRSFIVATSTLAMAAATAVGPFGATAAAPYVYGSTPAVAGAPVESSSAVPASVRIVSDVPVAATLSHQAAVGDRKPIVCMPMQP